MNIQTRVAGFVTVQMNDDGEVVIPEQVRRAAGLVPGMRVVIGVNDRGEAVVTTQARARRSGETAVQHRARMEAALNDAGSGRYSTGQTTAEVMTDLRGDRSS